MPPTRPTVRSVAIALAFAGVCAAGASAVAFAHARLALHVSDAATSKPMREGAVRQFWPNGQLKSEVHYSHDAYDGTYRTFYESGAAYELRHYVDGHEAGLQQSWSEDGTLYLNYEVHAGRRFGLVNATPCNTVGEAAAALAARRVDALSATSSSSTAPLPVDGPLPQASATSPAPGALPYYADASFAAHWAPVAHRVAPFRLTTQTGGVIADATLAGRPYVASFIYTQCAAVCPILVRQLSRVQAAVAGARIVSFSVTPDADTPSALARFGKERGIDPATWSLVTGDKRTIYALARSSYFADDSRVGASADDETALLHSEKLLLVDANGQLRGIYNGTQPHAVDQLIADLATLAHPDGRAL